MGINGIILANSDSDKVTLARKVLVDLDSIFTNAGIAANAHDIGFLKGKIGLNDEKRVSLLGEATVNNSIAIGNNARADQGNSIVIGWNRESLPELENNENGQGEELQELLQANNPDINKFKRGISESVVIHSGSAMIVIRDSNNLNNAYLDPIRDEKKLNIRVNANISPITNNVFSLGTDEKRWQDVYIDFNSLHIGTKEKEGTIGFDTDAGKLTLNAEHGIITKGIQFTLDSELRNCDPTFQRLYTDPQGQLRCTVDVSRVVDTIRLAPSFASLPGQVQELLNSNSQVKVRNDIFNRLGISTDSDPTKLPFGNLAKAEALVKDLKTGSIENLAESLVKKGKLAESLVEGGKLTIAFPGLVRYS